MDYYSFINTSILKDDLVKIGFGKFHDNNYLMNECVCFEPAFNRNNFYFIPKINRDKIKIIFYSRDNTIAARNLVKMVFDVLYEAYKNGIINNNIPLLFLFTGMFIVIVAIYYINMLYPQLFLPSNIL